MRLIIPLVLLSLFAFACNKQVEEEKNTPIAKVKNEILFRKELEAILPDGLSKDDSIRRSENYIHLWIKDNLMYEIASRNVVDNEKIKELVENYKKSLVIYQYQEQLINEKLSKKIDDAEMLSYYNTNKDKFKLDVVLLKGWFLKVPVDAPSIDEIRSWHQSSSKSTLEKLAKYSIQNAVIYDYFYDRWVEIHEVEDNLPTLNSNLAARLGQDKAIEVKDSSYFYFLHIKESLFPGNNAPFEYVKSTIKEMLINQRKMDFLKQIETDLYNTALEKKEIKLYYKEQKTK